jgi:hypothetical protein
MRNTQCNVKFGYKLNNRGKQRKAETREAQIDVFSSDKPFLHKESILGL